MWSDLCDAYRAALNDAPYLAGDRPAFASDRAGRRQSWHEVLIVSSGCQVADRPDGHPYRRPEIDQKNDLAFGHSSF